MIIKPSNFKAISGRFKRWHHIMFFGLIGVMITYYLMVQYPGIELEKLPFTAGYVSGRIILIALISTLFALIGGFILGLFRAVSAFRWFNFIIDSFFHFPPFLYAFILFIMISNHSFFSIIVIFTLLRTYPVITTISGELEKLNREQYIIELKALGVSPLRIVLLHILPEAMFSLFLEFLNSILWIIQMELLLTVTGLVTLYSPEYALGHLIYTALQGGEHLVVIGLMLYFSLFYIELKYMFQVLRFHFEQRIRRRSISG